MNVVDNDFTWSDLEDDWQAEVGDSVTRSCSTGLSCFAHSLSLLSISSLLPRAAWEIFSPQLNLEVTASALALALPCISVHCLVLASASAALPQKMPWLHHWKTAGWMYGVQWIVTITNPLLYYYCKTAALHWADWHDNNSQTVINDMHRQTDSLSILLLPLSNMTKLHNKPRVVDCHHVGDDVEWIHKLSHQHLQQLHNFYSLTITTCFQQTSGKSWIKALGTVRRVLLFYFVLW